MIDKLYNLMVAHPFAFQFVYTTLLGMWSAYVSSLDAPTKDDSQAYRSWFAVANALAFNFSRGLKIPRVEDSPNFQDAVKKASQ